MLSAKATAAVGARMLPLGRIAIWLARYGTVIELKWRRKVTMLIDAGQVFGQASANVERNRE